MKKLVLALVLLLSITASAQSLQKYTRGLKMTTAEINAIDTTRTDVVYRAYNTDLGIEIINRRDDQGWVPLVTAGGITDAQIAAGFLNIYPNADLDGTDDFSGDYNDLTNIPDFQETDSLNITFSKSLNLLNSSPNSRPQWWLRQQLTNDQAEFGEFSLQYNTPRMRSEFGTGFNSELALTGATASLDLNSDGTNKLYSFNVDFTSDNTVVRKKELDEAIAAGGGSGSLPTAGQFIYYTNTSTINVDGQEASKIYDLPLQTNLTPTAAFINDEKVNRIWAQYSDDTNTTVNLPSGISTGTVLYFSVPNTVSNSTLTIDFAEATANDVSIQQGQLAMVVKSNTTADPWHVLKTGGASSGGLTSDQIAFFNNKGEHMYEMRTSDFVWDSKDYSTITTGSNTGKRVINAVDGTNEVVTTINNISSSTGQNGFMESMTDNGYIGAIPGSGVTFQINHENISGGVRTVGKSNLDYAEKTDGVFNFVGASIEEFALAIANSYKEASAASGDNNSNSVGSWISQAGGTATVITDASAIGGRAIRADKNGNQYGGVYLDMGSNSAISNWTSGDYTNGLPTNVTMTFTADLKKSSDSNSVYYSFRVSGAGFQEGNITGLNSSTYTTKTWTFSLPSNITTTGGDGMKFLSNITDGVAGTLDIANVIVTFE